MTRVKECQEKKKKISDPKDKVHLYGLIERKRRKSSKNGWIALSKTYVVFLASSAAEKRSRR
jgi:hypothetical protein